MRFVLGEIWLSLALATLLGLALGWLLWKWRRRTVGRRDWEEQQAELGARRRSTSELESQMAELVVARNAAETDQVRLSAKVDDLEERAALVTTLEARIARQDRASVPSSPLRRSPPPASTTGSHGAPASADDQDSKPASSLDQARWAAATATGASQVEPSGSVEFPEASLAAPPPPPVDQADSTRRIAQLETATERANDRARDLAAQLDASSTHISEVDAERVRLRRELDESTQRVRQLDEELLSTKAKLTSAAKEQIPPSEIERLNLQIERSQADLDSRAEQTETLQVELRRRGGDLEARALESNRLGSELTKARDALDQRTRESVDATEALSQLQAQHASTSDELATVEASLATASANAAAERARTAELDEELQRRTMRIEALEARIAHLDSSEAEVVDLRGEILRLEQGTARAAALESEIVEIRRSNSDLRVRNEEAEQRALRVVELEAKLRGSQREAEELRSSSLTPTAMPEVERANLEHRAALVPQLETKISKLQRKLGERSTSHELDLETIRRDLDDSEARAVELQASIDKGPAKATKAKTKLLRSELGECSNNNKRLRRELKAAQKSADKSTARVDSMRAALAAAERDAAERATTISALRTDLVKARTAKASHRDKRLASAEAKAADLAARIGSAGNDDLKLINGIGPKLEKKLNDLGFTRFRQLAAMKKSDVEALQQQLPQFPGRIKRDQWVKQADRLHRSDKRK